LAAPATTGGTPPQLGEPAGGSRRTLWLVGIALLLQVFVWIGVQSGSPLLPDAETVWQPAAPLMLNYLVLMLLTAALILSLRANGPSTSGRPGQFLLRLSLGAGVTWVAVEALIRIDPSFLGLGYVAVNTNASARLEAIVYYVLFVAVTEELLFRATLPQFIKNPDRRWIMATVVFGLFHIWVYSTGLSNGQTWIDVVVELLTAMIFGYLLWFVYNKKWGGFGMAVGIHATWDLITIGSIGGLSILPLFLGH
jgi:hypothetical protein